MSNQLSDSALDLLTDLPRLAGSNAWAVSPERSATGHAMLASDPHLEINRLPAIWYEAVLRWGRQLRDGCYVAGLPAVCRGTHRKAQLGCHLHERRHDRLLHRRLSPRRHDGLAVSPRPMSGTISLSGGKRYSGKAPTRRR